MRYVHDKIQTDHYYNEYKSCFCAEPPKLQLIEFDKGELLCSPFLRLDCFYIITAGSVSIYDLTEDGSVRYIVKEGCGTLLGDIEFSGAAAQLFYTEAAETVVCLALPFEENKTALENDPIFLRYVLKQLSVKLSLSAMMDAATQTIEERVLYFLRNVEPRHEISSVNHALQLLHCSRRQLQRVLKKLCEEKIIVKIGRGRYQVTEP